MQKIVTGCLVIIGNEILSGRTVDANLAYIAKELNEVGVQLREVRVIPDIEATIIATVNAVRATFDYVFTTGGIGPTHDDITSLSIANAFGVKLLRHPIAEQQLRAYIPADKMNEARLKMADIPEGAHLINNSVSAAPGFIIGNVHVMAGVPKIMRAMLADILPKLNGGAKVQSVSITSNVPEGTLADGLTAIQAHYPTIDIGSYPTTIDGKHITTLVLKSPDSTQNDAALAETRTLLLNLGGTLMDELSA